jgi:hypothetical protein
VSAPQLKLGPHIREIPSSGTSVTSNLLPVDIYNQFENAANSKYLGILTTNQTPIREEITIKLNSCNASVQNSLPSRQLSKNVKIEMYRTITLSLVLY